MMLLKPVGWLWNDDTGIWKTFSKVTTAAARVGEKIIAVTVGLWLFRHNLHSVDSFIFTASYSASEVWRTHVWRHTINISLHIHQDQPIKSSYAWRRGWKKAFDTADPCCCVLWAELQIECPRSEKTKEIQYRHIHCSDCSSFPVRRMPHLLMSEQRCKQGFFLSATSSPLSSILTDVWVISSGGHRKKKKKRRFKASPVFLVLSTAAHFIPDWAFRLIGLSEEKSIKDDQESSLSEDASTIQGL